MTLTSVRKAAILLLFTTAIFEPSDRVFGMKVYLFSLFVLLGVVAFVVDDQATQQSFPQITYVFGLSLALPAYGLLMSLVIHPVNLGSDALQYFKSHLFLTFSLFLTPLALLRFGERAFVTLLTILAHVIIGLFVLTLVLPQPLFLAMVAFGRVTNLFLLGARDYGGVHFPTIYYTTAPLLVFSLAHWLERTRERATARNIYLFLVNMVALYLSGTRNDILLSLLIPAYYFYNARRGRLLVIAAMPLLLVIGAKVLQSMLSATDVSNSAKLAYLPDYAAILSDPRNLLLGQGLGTRFFAHGLGEVVSITELSYFEVVRTYGAIIGVVFFGFLIYPLVLLVRSRERTYYFTVGYAAYLVASYSDPYLLSSNGMMVLGLVAALAFQPQARHAPAFA